MIVQEILTLCPDAYGIMAEYGLHCSSCSIGGMESLGDGCAMHGFDDETIDALIDDLNESIVDQPVRPAHIEVSAEAAEALSSVAKQEKMDSCCLAVVMDGHGGFCMEFRDDVNKGDLEFAHENHPSVRVSASPEVLWRIGGAKIDHRDGRFKLDLPEDSTRSCACGKDGCCGEGECGC